jgi:hypothetical protein
MSIGKNDRELWILLGVKDWNLLVDMRIDGEKKWKSDGKRIRWICRLCK